MAEPPFFADLWAAERLQRTRRPWWRSYVPVLRASYPWQVWLRGYLRWRWHRLWVRWKGGA